ncbi:MAG: ABC transporter ATP-binding protein [Planctomycetota bacterium]
MSAFGGGYAGKAMKGVRRGDGDEEREDLSLGLIWRSIGYMRPYRWKRNALLASVLLRAVQIPLIAWFIGYTLHGPILGEDWSGLVWCGVGLLSLMLFTQTTMHFRQRWAQELGEAVVHDLRREVFAKLQRMPMRFYDRTKVGRIISRMTSDIEAMRVGVQDVLFISAIQLGHVVMASAVMLWYDPVLFGVVLLMSPIVLGMTRYFRPRLSEAWQDVQESFSRITSRLAEAITGIRVTQGFVRQEHNAAAFADQVAAHGELNMRAIRLQSVFIPLIELNNQFFISALLIVGGWQVLLMEGTVLPEWAVGFAGWGSGQEQTFAAMVVFFFMINLFFGGIAFVSRMFNMALTAMAGAQRVFTLLDEEVDPLQDEDAGVLPPIRGEVVFDEVGFAYDPEKPVLHGVSFTADPGQTIALVGHTGSGKSTIIKLISKFYLPTSGELRIDGQDVRKIQTESLIKQVGIVLQSNFLFTGTVLDNIRAGKPGASDEQVVAAARALDCLDLLEQLPEGLNTPVGENGTALSLGQRQLVCFTRAMLADPRILILDEATSSVDTMTEARIQRALETLLAGRTSFVVAHRLSTIRHADCVLVLDHGEIVERGTHTELLAEGGTYANLYRQFIHATDS